MGKYRFIIAIVLSLLIGGNAFAAELTAEQKKFRSSVETFLKEEGFMPTIDNEDNSLNFKKEGTLYWLSFGGTSPIYLEFHRAGLNCEDADRTLVLQSVNAANRKVRCAKAMLNDTSVSFAIEMYCHSSEEFRYVFYKCMKELENIKDEVSDFYNGTTSTSSSSSGSGSNYNSSLVSKFFPIYGITLGKTTLSQAESMGYKISTNDSGHKKCKVKDLTFWDFNDDKFFDYVSIYDYDQVPESLQKLGINWSLSYNRMIEKFKELGFSVIVTEQPTTEKWKGRNTLKAKFEAKAPNEKFEIRVDFSFGNENGEGYGVNSSNSFYSMTLDTD